jgi:transposase
VLLELTVAEQRFNAVMEVLRDGLTVTEVAERYGVSRQTVHGWLRRWKAGGLDALTNRSHRPDTCPHQMPATVEAHICELRRHHPGWGQRRLAHELARAGIDPPPGLTSIYRALVRNGLIQPRSRRRAKASYRRWERARPMELWQLDVMGGIWLTDGRELKAVTGIDDHSRFCVAAGLAERANAPSVCRIFTQALARYGSPEELLTDIHAEWRADRACGSGRPRRFISNRRSSVTAAIAIGAAWVDSLPVDRGGGRGPRRRGGAALLGT